MTLRLNSTGGGFVEADAPNIAGNYSLTLPTADGSAGQVLATNGAGVLSFINRLEWDQWRLTQAHSTNDELTNLVRESYTGIALQGSAMTVSSGVFTFPSTGLYLVIARGSFNIDGDDTVVLQTQTTTDNGSNYTVTGTASDGQISSTGTNRHGSATSFVFVDVTNTSQVKVKFVGSSIAGTSVINGNNTGAANTQFTFIRLGDT
jgi:hypothetical protein